MARGATGIVGGVAGIFSLAELLGRTSLLGAGRLSPVPAESFTSAALSPAAFAIGLSLTLVSTADGSARCGALLVVSGAAARTLLKSHKETSAPRAKAKMVKSTGVNGERARRGGAK
jgi:hypothetical protein